MKRVQRPRHQDGDLAVRFPLPMGKRRLRNSPWVRLGSLLPRRWLRQVVIQGQHFWLPG